MQERGHVEKARLARPLQPVALVAGDFDGDLDNDLVIANLGAVDSDSAELSVILNITPPPSSLDCNGNLIPDTCDLSSGTAVDCDANGIPDTCQLVDNDCNEDGIPDTCQLASNDCNNNGALDECDLALGGEAVDKDSSGILDECESSLFVRGDCNGDGEITGVVTDAVFLLTFNVTGGVFPQCVAACDADGDGEVRGVVTDAVYILTFNFLGGLAPAQPFPDCGRGTDNDAELTCEQPTGGCAGQ